jgi:hypothetical protein
MTPPTASRRAAAAAARTAGRISALGGTGAVDLL